MHDACCISLLRLQIFIIAGLRHKMFNKVSEIRGYCYHTHTNRYIYTVGHKHPHVSPLEMTPTTVLLTIFQIYGGALYRNPKQEGAKSIRLLSVLLISQKSKDIFNLVLDTRTPKGDTWECD